MSAIIPIPKLDLNIRPGTMEDIPFLDSLQKMHTKQVGWMPTKQFEGKIKLGHVLVAEESVGWALPTNAGEVGDAHPTRALPKPLGYCIGNDQYFKHDDIGIIYQMNVVPGHQRGLVGATLLKAQFERSAYGCKLYCCWCAQDIEANRFWESMGFVALAFRSGSRAKDRVHIFWQKRIRSGDCETPWWFPSQTGGGAIREDRLVLPIPPGVRWSDEMPRILPGGDVARESVPRLPGKRTKGTGETPVLQKPTCMRKQFCPPSAKPLPEPPAPPAPEVKKTKVKVPKQKNDPKLIAAARELRDRWLEKVNDDPSLIGGGGKYEVTRSLAVESPEVTPTPLLIEQASDLREPGRAAA